MGVAVESKSARSSAVGLRGTTTTGQREVLLEYDDTRGRGKDEGDRLTC